MTRNRNPVRRSPLANRSALGDAASGLSLREKPGRDKHVLRLDPDHQSLVREKSGLVLPLEACRSEATEAGTCLWLGPDEWLIVDAGEAVLTRLRDALGQSHFQLAEVSDYYSVIEIAGPPARAVLSKLTPLDLDPRVFPTHAVAGSVFAKAGATIHYRDDISGGPVFDLYIRWSMADYLWCLLAEGGREFGLTAQEPAGKVPLRA